MTSIQNNPDPYLGLVPPQTDGSMYTNLVTNAKGVPLGDVEDPQKTLAHTLGYPDTDTIGSALDETITELRNLNVLMQIWGASSDPLKDQLDSLDPSHPALPILQELVEISHQALKSGDLGGVKVNAPQEQVKRTSTDDKIDGHSSDISDAIDTGEEVLRNAGTGGATYTTTVGGNPWLAGNVYVAFLVNFMEMMKTLKESKIVQGDIEIATMGMIVELAKSAADAIMEAAKSRQMVHIVSAVMAGVSLVASVASFACMTVSAYKSFGAAKGMEKVGPDPTQASIDKVNINNSATQAKIGGYNQFFQLAQAGSSIAQSISQFGTSLTQAMSETVVAEKEGIKEILQAYRQIAQHQMEKSTEAFKAQTDLISQLIQQIDQMRQKLHEAVAGSLRRSG